MISKKVSCYFTHITGTCMHHYTKYTFHHILGCEDAQAHTEKDIE